MTFEEMLQAAYELAEKMVDDATLVDPVVLGLDRRVAHQLLVGDDFIAVGKSDDRTLQYYGGFEYIDKSCRQELGEYVFYWNEDNRVREAMNIAAGYAEDA